MHSTNAARSLMVNAGGLQQQRKATLKAFEATIAEQLEIIDTASDKSFTITSASRSCTSCFAFVQPAMQQCSKCRVPTAPALCSRRSRRGDYIGVLRETGLDPLRMWSLMAEKSIDEIAVCILKAQEASVQHDCQGAASCLLKTAFSLLNKRVAILASNTRGICLDCLNAEHDDIGFKPDCVVGHGKGGLVGALEAVVLD